MKIGLQSWGTRGDLNPFLTLAAGLRKAGHDVTFAYTAFSWINYKKFEKTFDIKIIDASNDSAYSAEFKPPITNKDELFINAIGMEECAMLASQKLCKENDIVIGNEGAYYLHAFAEIEKKPFVALSFNHALVPTKFKPFWMYGLKDLGEETNKHSWVELENSINKEFSPFVNEFRTKLGLAPLTNIYKQLTHSEVLNLIGVSKVLCEEQSDWANQWCVCGYLFSDNSDSINNIPNDLVNFIGDGEPPLFFGLGSSLYFTSNIVAILNVVIKAATHFKRKVIIQTQWGNIDLKEIHFNESVFPLDMGIDHRLVFKECSVIIHHGGSGTTHTACLCGVPSIIIEDGGDMPFWAAKLMELGVSPPSISMHGITYELLIDRLNIVLNSPQMKENAVYLSNIMKDENSIDIAVKAIEQKFQNRIK